MPRDLVLLADALRRALPFGAEITSVRQMAHGLSNSTYLLEGANKILRMAPDEAGLLPRYELDWQYAIYQRVAATPGAPAVPAVSHYCDDDAVAGGPFYLMERLQGETFDRHQLPTWLTSDPEACGQLCAAWVETMASAHRMPIATLAALSPRRTLAEEAAYWRAEAEAADAPALVQQILGSFVEQPPRATGAPTCVHGDPNLTNILWDGPRVVALLDWELSTIGEPFSDIAFLLTFFRDEDEPPEWGFDVPGWWSKPRVVAHWESLMGRRVANWRRHELLAMARLATILCKGANLVAAGQKTDLRVVAMSEKLGPYMERLGRRWERRDEV